MIVSSQWCRTFVIVFSLAITLDAMCGLFLFHQTWFRHHNDVFRAKVYDTSNDLIRNHLGEGKNENKIILERSRPTYAFQRLMQGYLSLSPNEKESSWCDFVRRTLLVDVSCGTISATHPLLVTGTGKAYDLWKYEISERAEINFVYQALLSQLYCFLWVSLFPLDLFSLRVFLFFTHPQTQSHVSLFSISDLLYMWKLYFWLYLPTIISFAVCLQPCVLRR